MVTAPQEFREAGNNFRLYEHRHKSSDPNIKPQQIITKWRQTTYHKPQDDMNQPFDFESAAKYARYNFFLGYLVALKPEKPAWNPGDFFGEHYAKKAN